MTLHRLLIHTFFTIEYANALFEQELQSECCGTCEAILGYMFEISHKISHALRQTTQAFTPAIYSSLNLVGATNNKNKALFFNCL